MATNVDVSEVYATATSSTSQIDVSEVYAVAALEPSQPRKVWDGVAWEWSWRKVWTGSAWE